MDTLIRFTVCQSCLTHYFPRSPSQPKNVTIIQVVLHYTAWWSPTVYIYKVKSFMLLVVVFIWSLHSSNMLLCSEAASVVVYGMQSFPIDDDCQLQPPRLPPHQTLHRLQTCQHRVNINYAAAIDRLWCGRSVFLVCHHCKTLNLNALKIGDKI